MCFVSTFDNTAANPFNPVVPPVEVGLGWRSLDEMCQVHIEGVDYMEGDELITYE